MENICRFCLSGSEVMRPLIEEILSKVWTCLSVQIKPHDLLPKQVCLRCVDRVEDIYQFKQTVTTNEKNLNYHLERGIESSNEICNNNLKKHRVQIQTSDNILDNTLEADEKINDEIADMKEDVEDFTDDDKNKCNDFNSEEEVTDLNLEELSSENVYLNEINSKFKIKGTFKCLTCFAFVETQAGLIKHYNTEHRNKKNDSYTNLYDVIRNDGGIVYKCKKCGKDYRSKRTVNRHIIAHIEDRPFVCKMCGRTYKTVSEIIRHGRAHSQNQLVCSFQCGYTTVYMGALKQHELRHKSVFKYTCEVCNKGFLVKTWYEQHQNIHKGLKPFACDICGMTFHMDRYLTAHRSRQHPQSSNLKRYVCVHCSLPCDSRQTLTEHLKVHGIKRIYLCDLCGKELSNVIQLKIHKRGHLGIKPHTCSVCNKAFTKKFNLQVHERSHTAKKPYNCSKCGKHYSQRSSLNRHQMKHHKHQISSYKSGQ